MGPRYGDRQMDLEKTLRKKLALLFAPLENGDPQEFADLVVDQMVKKGADIKPFSEVSELLRHYVRELTPPKKKDR